MQGGLRRLALRQLRARGIELSHARLAARAKPRAKREDDDGFGDEGSEFDAQDAERRNGERAKGAHAARGTGTSKGRFAARREPLTIEGELVAKSTGTTSAFAVGDRVFHIKFGNGDVIAIDGNKLTILFDKAGEKRVVDSFVERV